MGRICIVPELGTGGPATFQRNLVTSLKSRGIAVTHDLNDEPFDTVLIINGTRHLRQLWRCKQKGKRIIQRLGIPNQPLLPAHSNCLLNAHATARNLLMRLIRNNIADGIIYQSRFASDLWREYAGKAEAEETTIHNGVDLEQFRPDGPKYQTRAQVCLISVEGAQGADPFDILVNLGEHLRRTNLDFEILVFGTSWNNARARFSQHSFMKFMGHIPASQLPHFYRGAHLFISTDIIAGCPNSVLEALACGVPVLGYDSGVLPELIDESSGRCVPCEGDLSGTGQAPGNLKALCEAARELIKDRGRFGRGARHLAERRYGRDRMTEQYLQLLLDATAST